MSELSINLIKRHEGKDLNLYKCSADKWTIGYGHNIEDNGITERVATIMLHEDLEAVRFELLDRFDWYQSLDDVRKAVVENMVFNMGISRFMGFKKMHAAVARDDFEEASVQMLDSKWHSEGQVGNRSIELANMMLSGEVM